MTFPALPRRSGDLVFGGHLVLALAMAFWRAFESLPGLSSEDGGSFTTSQAGRLLAFATLVLAGLALAFAAWWFRSVRGWIAGHESTARVLFEKSGVFTLPDLPGLCFAQARERRQNGDALFAACLESAAQRDFAREHAVAGRYLDAKRNYRQDLHVTAEFESQEPREVRLELCSALQLGGRTEDARKEFTDLAPSAAEFAALPEWARGKLDPLLEAPR